MIKSIGYSEHDNREIKNPSFFKSITFKPTKDFK